MQVRMDLAEVYGEYDDLVARYFRNHLPSRLQARLGVDDLQQEFWRTLVRSWPKLNQTSRTELQFVLLAIAKRQLVKHLRRHDSRQRACSRDISQEFCTEPCEATTASRILASRELLFRIASIVEEREWRVITMKMEGESNVAIGEELGVDEGTVRRIILAVKRKLINDGISPSDYLR